MRWSKLLIVSLIAGAGVAQTAQGAAQDAGSDAKLNGTYTQNVPCKGDGSDDGKKLVKIAANEVTSNFGPCTMSDKQWSGETLKANATCRAKSGSSLDIQLSFTLKPDNTVDFLEESSQYKSVLYRCPAGK